MGARAFALFFTLLSAGAASAQDSYSFSDPTEAALDKACLTALAAKLLELFDGNVTTQHSMPSITPELQAGVTTILYPTVTFSGDYGSETGAVVCIAPTGAPNPSDIEVAFNGEGLPGFKKHPLATTIKDPLKQRSRGFGSWLIAQ